MDEEKQNPEEPKITIEDLATGEKAAEAEAENVTGGGGVLQQSFNPQQLAGTGGKEEVQGLLNK